MCLQPTAVKLYVTKLINNLPVDAKQLITRCYPKPFYAYEKLR
jgi:hypothetical protein